MYHAAMQSCGMKGTDMNVKVVGKSGQISLGKALAGAEFIVEQMPGGDIILKRALVIPMNERWLHEPGVQAKLKKAQQWMETNPPKATNLDKLQAALGEPA